MPDRSYPLKYFNLKKAGPPVAAYRELIYPAVRVIAVAVIAVHFLVAGAVVYGCGRGSFSLIRLTNYGSWFFHNDSSLC